MECTGERFGDECSVNLLADGRAVASNEDGGNTSPYVGPSPSTAINLQVAHLELGPADTHRKGCGQPLLAKGIMYDNGKATASKKSFDLQENEELEYSTSTSSATVLGEIKVPPPMRKCGRPKGHALTVIGLPKRKKNATTERVPFKCLSMREKRKIILAWLVGECSAKAAMQGKQLQESDVEQRPEFVHCAVLDENVDVNCVRSFFFRGCLGSCHKSPKMQKNSAEMGMWNVQR